MNPTALKYIGNSAIPRTMKYRFNELKLEQLVSYFKDNVIDLAPAFQRGRVWKRKLRQGLVKNILQGRPVPAIFLYKRPEGSKNTYVILDGKQRLESILLYIGDQREDLKIPAWRAYFSKQSDKDQAHFSASIGGKKKTLSDLSNDEIRQFRDYMLSIIEIDLDETATLDEMIQLFVDINSYGVKVKRFDIVKALYLEDALLSQMFNLVAIKMKRQSDTYYKVRNSVFTRVFKKLDIVQRVTDPMNRTDIIWEKLFELALFTTTGQHRKPVQILKEFIRKKGSADGTPKLPAYQIGLLRSVFSFVDKGYSHGLAKTRLATDQTHFYTMMSVLINDAKKNQQQDPKLISKMIAFDGLLKNHRKAPAKIKADVSRYLELSEKQTTDASKRSEREILFRDILASL